MLILCNTFLFYWQPHIPLEQGKTMPRKTGRGSNHSTRFGGVWTSCCTWRSVQSSNSKRAFFSGNWIIPKLVTSQQSKQIRVSQGPYKK